MVRAIGVDFGTTNSAIAVARDNGSVQLATFDFNGDRTKVFRSILYFSTEESTKGARPSAIAGHEAIKKYLAERTHGRLIQSVKSYLASRLFKNTNIFNYTYTLEDLIAIILRQLKAAAEEQFGAMKGKVVVGRPVHFSGATDQADDEFALSRLRRAVEAAGFENVVFEYEPVAAAYKYQTGLDHEELVL